jgi:hypothetical protein|tara:strand:+ start:50 stop:619 length:570 start_codon:yes stop_codon:yes gene_type:complete
MKIHSVSFEDKMRILEFDFKTLRNFEKINNDLEKDILSRGDEQNKKTNVKAMMTSWQMADQFKSFQDLLKVIVIHVLPKYDNLEIVSGGNAKIIATGMWGAIYRKGDYTIEHNHIGSQYSFVYYVKSEKDAAPIIFTSPGKIELKPCTGNLLLWDGRYNHMVPEHISDNPRIIVAGNLNWQLPDKRKYV